jgi:hypothetical protein
MELVLYIAMAVLAIWFRYDLQMTQACLYVGRAISDTGSKRGYQNAVTSPTGAYLSFLVWGLLAVVTVYGFFALGIGTGAILVAEFLVISVVTGMLIPKPDSRFWVRQIFASLVRRTADYARKNDKMRSDAARALATLMEERLADKLVE